MPKGPIPSTFDTPDALRARVMAKVDQSGECWLWIGAMFENGYGQILVSRKPLGAHRVMWQLEYGEIPDGMCVCYRCDNRRCVRSSHLFLGTKTENSADMLAKGRAAKGERQGSAKLTDADIRAIRYEYAALGASRSERYGAVRDLCRRFDVDRTAIYQIVRRATWRHVE